MTVASFVSQLFKSSEDGLWSDEARLTSNISTNIPPRDRVLLCDLLLRMHLSLPQHIKLLAQPHDGFFGSRRGLCATVAAEPASEPRHDGGYENCRGERGGGSAVVVVVVVMMVVVIVVVGRRRFDGRWR